MHQAARCLFFIFCLSFTVLFASADVFGQSVTAPQIAKNETETAVAEEEKKPAETTAAEDLKSTNRLFNRVGVSQTDSVPLTLNEAIRRALENNNSIEIARDEVRVQETRLRSLFGFYDPEATVSPVISRSATTGSDASNDFRVDSSFTQQIRPGGGNYNVFLNTSQTGVNSQNNTVFNQTSGLGSSSGRTYFSTLGVNYNQPLLRNFSVDQNRRQIRIQRKVLQQTDAEFRRNTIEVITQVQRSYWDLVFALRDQQNKAANLNLARENLRLIEARIEAGAAAPLARAEVATELANRETELLSATEQVSIAENALKQLVLRETTAPEWSSSFVPTDAPVFNLEPISLDESVKDAVENRPELRRLRLQTEINNIDIEFFRNQTKPRLDLNSTVSLGGLALGDLTNAGGTTTLPLIFGDPNLNADSFLLNGLNEVRLLNNLPALVPPTITVTNSPAFFNGGTIRSLQNLFRTDSLSYSFGVTFSFPIGNRTAKENLAGARILQEQNNAEIRSQEQVVITEVRNAVQAVETARQRVLSARSAVENAQIQLDGERKLFEVGRSTQFLLFERENTLANARNSLIRAETDYNKALADLQRATSTTFRTNNIEVESPTDDDN